MKQKEVLLFIITGALLLSGCSAQIKSDKNDQENTQSASLTDSGIVEIDTSDMFLKRDQEVEYEEEECAIIQLSDDGSSCGSDAVKISENTVTITDEGTYLLTGTLTDGMIIVEAEDTDKVRVVLKNVEVSNSQSAALYVRSADKVFVTTAEGTENYLKNGGTYTAIDENNIDAAVFSKSDLTLNGTGKLTVTADAGHGIVSKDDLVFTGGIYEITSASHGICGKDSIRIADGSYKITAGKDGIHAENADDASLGFVYLKDGTFEITSSQDGISAGLWLQAEDGTYNIVSGEGGKNAQTQTSTEQMPMDRQPDKMVSEDGTAEDRTAEGRAAEDTTTEDTISVKGMKAATQLVLNGGSYTLDCEDDALHTNGNFLLSGGTYTLYSKDDGIHGDSKVAISGGTVDVKQSYEGIEGLSIDISGGEISVQASDDGMNAAGGNDSSGFEGPEPGGDQFDSTEGAYINIAGGILHINAYGDGIDSNGDVTISGGETYVSGPENSGNGTLDYSGTAVVTGGVFAASGSSGMAQNFSESSVQGTMMVMVDAQQADTNISLINSSGNEILSWTADKQYSSVIISSPQIKEGETYALKAGEAEQTVSMESLLYGSSSQMGGDPAGKGGMQGGRMQGGEMQGGEMQGSGMQGGEMKGGKMQNGETQEGQENPRDETPSDSAVPGEQSL